MIYLKSVLAGFMAVVIATVAVPILVVMGIILTSGFHSSQEGTVGWDPISIFYQSPWYRSLLPVVAYIVFVFAAGFFWEFRRLAHR